MKTLRDIQNEYRSTVVEETKHDLVEAPKEVAGDLPVILILKRRSVRVFPDGQRVALYWSDKLKTYVSVPYNSVGVGFKAGNVANTSEEVQLEPLTSENLTPIVERVVDSQRTFRTKKFFTEAPKTNLDIIKTIAESKKKSTLNFADGNSTKCDVITASAIVKIYETVSPENKRKMNEAINKSKESFEKISEFSLSKV
jgi:hypothetical protein